MKPDATKHNPDPRYLRGLLEKAGINQVDAARAIGITDRALRNYLSLKGDHREAPYPIQYALEGLLLDGSKESEMFKVTNIEGRGLELHANGKAFPVYQFTADSLIAQAELTDEYEIQCIREIYAAVDVLKALPMGHPGAPVLGQALDAFLIESFK